MVLAPLSGGLDRDVILDVVDLIVGAEINERGFVFAYVLCFNPSVTADNDPIARAGLVRGRAVDRDDPGVIFGANGVSGESLTVVYVVDMNLFILMDAGPFQQMPIYRA